MENVSRIELAIVLFALGLVISLGYLALRPLIRRLQRGMPAAHAGTPVKQRPIWVVLVLSIFTLGMYLFVWFGQSWSELTRVAGKLDKSPSSHLWAMTGFGYFSRVRAHFRTINEQCALRGLPTGVGPGAALAMITSVVLIPLLVANGQRSLNRLWEHDFGSASRRGASEGEWIAIIALVLMFAPVVIFSV